MERLLILACSQAKVRMRRKLRALDRYDGPAFRVLRKHVLSKADGQLIVFVLSAKFGLIEAEREIPWYDCRLSRASASDLRPQILARASEVFAYPWRSIGLCAGKEYLTLLNEALELASPEVRPEVLSGGLGRRLTALRDWLQREPALPPLP
jgi:hypothetical protein